MAKEQIRKTGTDDAIRGAFWKLYSKKPITDITVKELTRIAGVHRSSFYGHYDDIYDLLHQCEEELLSEMEDCTDLDSSIENGSSHIEHVISFYQDRLEQVSCLLGPHGDPGFLIRLREKAIPLVMQQMAIPSDCKLSYYTLDLILTSILTFLTTWYSREKTIPSREMILEIRHIIMDGCRDTLLANTSEPEAVTKYLDKSR